MLWLEFMHKSQTSLKHGLVLCAEGLKGLGTQLVGRELAYRECKYKALNLVPNNLSVIQGRGNH